ncbi:hypothetical protein [Kineococcus esterisolvens]|uniref:hypothetical protein n=1 Tax=unclassified Kineococcus TaxID=2621656 RepID=UPI003D7E0A0E
MDTTTTANVDMRTALDATPAALCRSAVTWKPSHASTPGLTTGGVRPVAPAVRLRGGVEAYRLRAQGSSLAGIGARSTVPSSGTTLTSPPV